MAQHQHLPLRRLEGALERRQHGFGKIPERDAKLHGGDISAKIQAVITGHKEKPKIADIDPALILKVQSVGPIPEATWNALGMTVLADEADMSLILFANDAELKEFRRRLAGYIAARQDANSVANLLMAHTFRRGGLAEVAFDYHFLGGRVAEMRPLPDFA